MPPIPNFVDEWFIFFPLYLSFLLKNFKYQRQTIRFDYTFSIEFRHFCTNQECLYVQIKARILSIQVFGALYCRKNNIRLTPRRGNSVSWNVEAWCSQTKKVPSPISGIRKLFSFSLVGNFLQLCKGTNFLVLI